MNGATLGAIAAAVLSMLAAALALWVNRTDRASKLTREGMDSLLRDTRTLTAMRRDVWNWEAWGHRVNDAWDTQQDQLLRNGSITQKTPLPAMPESELRKLEREYDEEDRK